MKNKPVYHSKVLQRLMEEMDKDSWHVKLKRSIRVHIWVWICMKRKYWDKSFEGYIWKKKI